MVGVSNKKVISELKKLKKKLSKEINIEKMLLFGSRARNEELETSDVDIIVVSKDFSKTSFRKRPDRFLDEWFLPVDLEVLCYSPEEILRKQKEIGLVQEALKDAVEI
jgi:predicted nucleotidyltransferase